jgi:hypothetical protein
LLKALERLQNFLRASTDNETRNILNFSRIQAPAIVTAPDVDGVRISLELGDIVYSTLGKLKTSGNYHVTLATHLIGNNTIRPGHDNLYGSQ